MSKRPVCNVYILYNEQDSDSVVPLTYEQEQERALSTGKKAIKEESATMKRCLVCNMNHYIM